MRNLSCCPHVYRVVFDFLSAKYGNYFELHKNFNVFNILALQMLNVLKSLRMSNKSSNFVGVKVRVRP